MYVYCVVRSGHLWYDPKDQLVSIHKERKSAEKRVESKNVKNSAYTYKVFRKKVIDE